MLDDADCAGYSLVFKNVHHCVPVIIERFGILVRVEGYPLSVDASARKHWTDNVGNFAIIKNAFDVPISSDERKVLLD